MKKRTLDEIANLLQAERIGDPCLEIHQVVHPAQAQSPNDLALILDEGVLPLLEQKQVHTALVPEGLTLEQVPNQIRVKRPKVALAKLLEVFDRPVYVTSGIHPSAVVDPSARLGDGVVVGPLCYVGPGAVLGRGTRLVSHVTVGADVITGEDCLFHAGVRIGDRVRIGNRVILQANVSIGSDGYSYVTPEVGSVESARKSGKIEAQNTQLIRINSIGTVVLEDDVEIGANSCVDRATLGETRIGKGTKIDNLVQIGHNVTIGQNCLLVAQVGIAGSCRIGDRVVFCGQAGVKDHATIGNDSIILPQAGVAGDIAEKAIVAGTPAIPQRELLYQFMQIKRLKSLHQKVDDVAKRLEQLEQERQTMEQPV